MAAVGDVLYNTHLIGGGDCYYFVDSVGDTITADTSGNFARPLTMLVPCSGIKLDDQGKAVEHAANLKFDITFDIESQSIANIALGTEDVWDTTDYQGWKKIHIDLSPDALAKVNGPLNIGNLSNIELKTTKTQIADTSQSKTYDPAGKTVAQASGCISPSAGFSPEMIDILPSWFVGAHADTGDAEYIPQFSKYRQISLIKNPMVKTKGGLDVATASYINPLPYFTLTHDASDPDIPISNTNINPGMRIVNSEDDSVHLGTLVYIQTQVSEHNRTPLEPQEIRYYYQPCSRDGYEPITSGLRVTFVDPRYPKTMRVPTGATRSVLNVYTSNYVAGTGEVLFIDNRKEVEQEPTQNEEIKLIIQL